MHFDDRLQTLLAAPIVDSRDRSVRWRQLVDLLARIEVSDHAATRMALDIIRRDAFAIDEDVRAATVRSIAGRDLPLDLLAILAAQPVAIAAPLFAGVTLSSDDAHRVLVDADANVRALVTIAAEAQRDSEPDLAANSAEPRISDMVERIERLQQQRVPRDRPAPAPAPASAPHRAPSRRPPAQQAGEAQLFEWESDASGHIDWVDGAPRGALVGRPLGGEGGALLERAMAPDLARHHPFVDAPMALGDLMAGTWSATGAPGFDPTTGRFLGYRGLARRSDGAVASLAKKPEPDLDSLREMVHEIKTPLNAIIGFAEIIDGQYLGPAHRRYRERAQSIVGQARQLLEAVEDLDLAAKLRAGRHRPLERDGDAMNGRLSDLLATLAPEINACLSINGGVVDLDIDHGRDRWALSPDVATRLLRRLLLSLCKIVGRGETLRIAASRRGTMCLMTIARPQLLAGHSEAQLVDPAFDPSGGDEAQSIGLGFALRLVRGLARVAGGRLIIDEHRLTLELPAFDA